MGRYAAPGYEAGSAGGVVYDLIVEDATIVSARSRSVAHVAVEDGRIAYIGARPGGPARKRVAGAGRFLLPGFVDAHVHFRDPGAAHKEDWSSGSRAAVSSGVTTVCDMPNTSPPTIDRATWEDKRRRAESASAAHFGLWIGATDTNVDAQNELMGSGDACGIKVFMGASTGPLLVSDVGLERLFQGSRGLIGVHAEDEKLLQERRVHFQNDPSPDHNVVRPPEAAASALRRLIQLTRSFPRPVHVCHVSTDAELAELNRVRGTLPITTEVCAHHLFAVPDARIPRHKVNPPLRGDADRRVLWAALKRGWLDTLGSDHAPHTLAEKDRPYWEAPSGLPGVETTLPLMLAAVRAGRLTIERLVELGAEAPARVFGFSRKGRVEVGADADFFLLGSGELVELATTMLLTRVGWSPFLGQKVAPKPEMVFVSGRLVAENGQIVDDTVRGSLVRPG